MRRRDGSIFPTRHTVTPVQEINGQLLVISLVRDLSEDAETGEDEALGRLTEREREVFQLTLKGLTSRQTADALGISPRTIERHRAAILDKFSVSSVKELMAEMLIGRAIERWRHTSSEGGSRRSRDTPAPDPH